MRDRGIGICMAPGCSQRAYEAPGGVPMCEPHIGRVMEALAPGPIEVVGPIRIFSVVYYLMFESDPSRIKIGSSTTPSARFKALESRNGPSKLIACTPGHIREEKIVHRRFRDLRVPGRGELFEFRGRLMEHVKDVRREHPNWRELPQLVERQ